jgi:putative flippase GtrA
MRIPREFIAIVPVSAVALLVDAGVLHALMRFAHLHYLLAASTGFLAGLYVNYALSVRFVFGFRRLSSTSQEFMAFAAIGLGGLLLNGLVMAAAVDGLHLHPLLGKGAAAVATFVFNFGLRLRLLFTPDKEAL